jgi:hypothetical protein
MAFRAIRDTFAVEQIDADTAVRRLIKAGDAVPPHYTPESEQDVVDDESATPLIVGNPAGSTPKVMPRKVPPPAKAEKK